MYRVGGSGNGSLMAEQRRRVAEFKKFVMVVRKVNALANERDRWPVEGPSQARRTDGDKGFEEAAPP